jgi:hypothetical protein
VEKREVGGVGGGGMTDWKLRLKMVDVTSREQGERERQVMMREISIGEDTGHGDKKDDLEIFSNPHPNPVVGR